MNKRIYIQYLFVLFVVFQSCINESSQWRGPNRDGIYPETGLLKIWPKEGPELAWSFDKLGKGFSSAAVSQKAVYINGVIDSIGNLFAFDLKGNLLWKKEYGKEWTKNFPGTRTTPLVYEGCIYILSGFGDLYCLKAENGEQIWTKNVLNEFNAENVTFGITENLVIDEDKIICVPGGKEKNIVALNRETGETIWVSKGVGEKSAYCSPLVITHNEKKFLITMTDSSLISVDAENGKLAWRYGDLIYRFPEHPNTPIYKNGNLFAIDGGKGGSVKLKLSNDGLNYDVAWKSNVVDQVFGSAILLEDKIVSYSKSKKQWSAIDWNSGAFLFSMDTISEGSVIYADDMFYCFTYTGEMVLMKVSDNSMELVSSFKLDGKKRDHFAHPVIRDKKLYLRYHDNLWVYNLSKK